MSLVAPAAAIIEFPPFRPSALSFQLPDDFAAQAVQLAYRQQNAAAQNIFQFAEFKRCSAKSSELFAQFLFGQRLLVRPGQRHGGFEPGDISEFIVRDEREGFAGNAMHLDFDGSLEPWRVARETLTQPPVQFRVAGFP